MTQWSMPVIVMMPSYNHTRASSGERAPLSPRLVVPAAMLFSTFAWSFVFVSLPFHVRELSTLDAAGTLRWTGWILGITNLVTVVTAPVWGRLGMRYDPKALYMVVECLQGVTFFGM